MQFLHENLILIRPSRCFPQTEYSVNGLFSWQSLQRLKSGVDSFSVMEIPFQSLVISGWWRLLPSSVAPFIRPCVLREGTYNALSLNEYQGPNYP